ncbi:MAG TPA: cyclic nucleotide-binding domain-containing protein [Burkholderiales bacterium]|nr:cyclic nucleotide-binding domain-containing protein [Burkholderiales bacterium]
MVQIDEKFPADEHQLRRFERVADNAAVAEELATLLGRAPLFAEFSRDDINALAEYMGVYRSDANETIIREGDLGDYLLLIIRGEVDILKTGFALEQQHMTTVGAGTTIGEMSMIDGEPRFATCRTTQVTTFSVLTRENMAKMTLERPQLGAKILVKLVTMLSARLRQTSAKLMRYMEGMA